MTAVLDGGPGSASTPAEHERILGPARKAAERDLPVAIAQDWELGATTVSASVALAAAAGIAVFATGGIGGVHRGAELDRRHLGRPRRHRPPPGRDGLRRRQGVPRPAADARAPRDGRRSRARLAPRLVPGLLHAVVRVARAPSGGDRRRGRRRAGQSQPRRGPACCSSCRSRRPPSSTPAELDAVLDARARRCRRAPDHRRRRHPVRARSHRRGHVRSQRAGQPRPRRAQRLRRRRDRRRRRRLPSEVTASVFVGRARTFYSGHVPRGISGGPRISPLRSTVTGPSSLTTITVAAGSSKLYRRPDVWRMPRKPSTRVSASALGTSRTPSSRRMPSCVEHGGAVDLGEGVAQRGEVARPVMSSGGGGGRRPRTSAPGRRPGGTARIAPMPRAPRSWTANSSSVSSTSRSPWAARATASIHVADRRLVVPRQAVPPQHAEVADDAHRPVRVALHDRCAHRLGEHDEVALRAGRPVEHGPLVVAVARRINQLASPSANSARRSAASPRPAARVTCSCVPTSHPSGSVVGSMIAPTLGTRRSWTCGRSA